MTFLLSTILAPILSFILFRGSRARAVSKRCSRAPLQDGTDILDIGQLELCEPKLEALSEDGSVLEVCHKCEMHLVWLVKDKVPYKIMERSQNESQYREVYSFGSSSNEMTKAPLTK